MKITFLILILNLSLFTMSDSNVLIAPSETTTTGIGFGRTKKNCEGRGFCVIEASFNNSIVGDHLTRATLTFSDRSISSIYFTNKDLGEQERRKYFSGDYFAVDEDFKTQLKIKGRTLDIYISEGMYEINRDKEGLEILMLKAKTKGK